MTEAPRVGARPSLGRVLATPRRGLRRVEAAAYVGVSETKFDELVKDGRMPAPGKLDGCVIWDVRRLDLAFDALFEPLTAGDTWAGI